MRRIRQLHAVYAIIRVMMMLYFMWYTMSLSVTRSIQLREGKKSRKRFRLIILNRLTSESDVFCRNELRMDRHVFNVLCKMLREIGGLSGTKNMSIQEIVAMFLYTLAHHKKNRTVAHYFIRRDESVSRHFNRCLIAVLKLHQHLLKTPTPISEDCEDERWNCFKNCLGALDGTYIGVSPPSEEKPKYRTRKSTISMNVLGACTPNMEFMYVLAGWEGSAHDDRVLRNVVSRPDGLRVPRGCYYLVDGGYANSEGFLAPYRGQQYHLKTWGNRQPSSTEEYLNMKYARARNVIERLFGVLKGRWSILRSLSFFPIRTQGRIVLACCLLHNLIKQHMSNDEVEDEENEEEEEPHIESRLKHWSEKYCAMAEMLDISGFSWDDEKKLLQVERSVYEEWIKTHKKAKGLYGVPFTYYDMLAEIYGKDKATGQASQSFVQAAHNIEIDLTRQGSTTIDSEDDIDIEDEFEVESLQSGSSSRKRKSASAGKSIKKPKTSLTKRMDNVGDLTTSLQSATMEFGKFFQDMNANLSTMAQA